VVVSLTVSMVMLLTLSPMTVLATAEPLLPRVETELNVPVMTSTPVPSFQCQVITEGVMPIPLMLALAGLMQAVAAV